MVKLRGWGLMVALALLLQACGLASSGSVQIQPAAPIPNPQLERSATPRVLDLSSPTPAAQSIPTHLPTWTPYPTAIQPTSPVVGVLGFPPGINPLTGLAAADPALLNRRPIMVKVSNFPSDARPQAGLSFADVVFEYYIGEFMYRFLAVFYGQNAEKVGPIRSGRFVDAQLVNMYGGLLMYGSADARVDDVLVQTLGKRAISHLEAPCPAVCGQDTHTHSVFTNTAELSAFADKNGINNDHPNLTGMVFDQRTPNGDQLALGLAVQYVKFYRNEWRYDPETQRYLHWMDDDSLRVPPIMVPLTDRLTQEQLAFDNVVLIFANYIEYNPTLHDIDIWKNTAGERAIFFRDGVMSEGSWKAPAYDRPIQFFNRWGVPYGLKPGRTWIVIVGNSSKFEQISDGQWIVKYDLP